MQITITLPHPRNWKWLLLAILALVVTIGWSSGAGDAAEAGGSPGVARINKVDSVTSAPLGQSCYSVADVFIGPTLFEVCDNDFSSGFPQSHAVCSGDGICNDENPADGVIEVTLESALYFVVEIQAPPGYNIATGTQFCDLGLFTLCIANFADDAKPPAEINITHDGRYALPKTCFDVQDGTFNPLFVVCDNDFQGAPDANAVCLPDGVCEDEDPNPGLIRVTVAPSAVYSVLVSKAPVNHVADPSMPLCVGISGTKCELVFESAPKNDPWFPWDVNGDGGVVANDISALVAHFGECKVCP